jgi:hypothetical protein
VNDDVTDEVLVYAGERPGAVGYDVIKNMARELQRRRAEEECIRAFLAADEPTTKSVPTSSSLVVAERDFEAGDAARLLDAQESVAAWWRYEVAEDGLSAEEDTQRTQELAALDRAIRAAEKAEVGRE